MKALDSDGDVVRDVLLLGQRGRRSRVMAVSAVGVRVVIVGSRRALATAANTSAV